LLDLDAQEVAGFEVDRIRVALLGAEGPFEGLTGSQLRRIGEAGHTVQEDGGHQQPVEAAVGTVWPPRAAGEAVGAHRSLFPAGLGPPRPRRSVR
jgi:hypothetical protein